MDKTRSLTRLADPVSLLFRLYQRQKLIFINEVKKEEGRDTKIQPFISPSYPSSTCPLFLPHQASLCVTGERVKVSLQNLQFS